MLIQAIIMGMSPYQFWHEVPSLFFNYLEAYSRKKSQDYEDGMIKMNFKAWLHGLYVDYALKVNPSFGKSGRYLEKPIEFKNEKEEKLKALSQEEQEAFQERLAISQFENFGKYAQLYNESFYGEEGGE